MVEITLGRKFTPIAGNRPAMDAYPGRQTKLGSLAIDRFLPVRERRLVGPWCFLDRFGPLSFSSGTPMNVPPHPHIGLQTVSWLQEGEVLHTDSLQNEAVVRPGGVNVMTAGRGISHTEETPANNSGRLRGVQLWVALPDSVRNMAPSFFHLSQVPKVEMKGGIVSIFAGSSCEDTSPGPHYSGIVGLEVQVRRGASLEMSLNEEYEHAVLLLDGDACFEDQSLDINKLYYLGIRRADLRFSSQGGGQLLIIGGTPFMDPILMWWNFVARTPDELMGARTAWELGQQFGEVPGIHGEKLSAPPPIQFARPNPAS